MPASRHISRGLHMRIMGIEFAASDMHYVVIDCVDGDQAIVAANRLSLEDTRSRQAVTAFQSALATTLNGHNADLIAVKAKPEKGRLMAGAAALKMEGLLLANARVDVVFLSGSRVGRTETIANSLHGYLQVALLTALAAR